MSSLADTYRITIIGAGIIGLTTACTLLKEYAANENLQLTIISEKFTPETTGDTSGGFWEPYGFKNIDERILRWAAYTYDIFVSEFFSTKAARAGVMKLALYRLRGFNGQNKDDIKAIEKPKYVGLVRHFRLLDQHELGMFDHLKPTSGYAVSSVAVEVIKYLPQLQRFLSEDGRVKFIKKKIHSLIELKDKADVVINCSGLASRHLVGDQTVRPARGQIIRVYAPWIKSVYEVDSEEGLGYVIPQSDTVVLGGTFQLDDWNTNIDENDTRKILRICAKAFPALEQIRHGKVEVGLRPYRDNGVRLEHEKTADGIDVVHCYGHSGGGVTLSWGCAKDVVDIVKTLLPPNPKRQNNTKDNLPEHEQLWRLIPNFEDVILRAKI
ncbi:unnamed protein product [Rotaria sp. Silwood1]|nr:unnamed protein product [Rotaria sp. Silwood1]CAF1614313.1 unnamed protein product [Rotaria sp. Silwood1]CAF3630298.1 unnamed protein product [Rotaria sp. Silwood1]CAF3828635.1 unnamed protein product [Rotaria sp. Silwood1]CAF4793022.1 unnamed protein product [Rotaria sp. Silwood1]